jgi:hypothetical protein
MNPRCVAALRLQIEAEARAEDLDWETKYAHQAGDHWDAAMAVLGVEPFRKD